MNWRRGILLAVVQLAVASSMMLMLETRDSRYLADREQEAWEAARPKPPEPPPAPEPTPVRPQESTSEESFVIDLCTMEGVHYPSQTELVRSANYPILYLTQWRFPCPAPWSLSGWFHAGGPRSWEPTRALLAAERSADSAMCGAVVLFWFLMGSLPLRKPARWWAEPGAFITTCTILSGLLALIPNLGSLALMPMALGAFGWLWWFGLLVWALVRSIWRLARRLRTVAV